MKGIDIIEVSRDGNIVKGIRIKDADGRIFEIRGTSYSNEALAISTEALPEKVKRYRLTGQIFGFLPLEGLSPLYANKEVAEAARDRVKKEVPNASVAVEEVEMTEAEAAPLTAKAVTPDDLDLPF